jgi:hypothetical protein
MPRIIGFKVAMSIDWFRRNWMYAGLVAAVFLLAVLPVVSAGLNRPLIAVYLLLPVYMLHQVEEHHDDRFRKFVNEVMGGGREVLSTPAVVVINIGGVWLISLIVLYLARFVSVGLGLIAVYLTLVNAVVHVLGAVALRRYNPGLVTAILLFLPVGIWALIVVSSAPGVTAIDQVIGLAVAVLIHMAIIGYAKRREALLAGRN